MKHFCVVGLLLLASGCGGLNPKSASPPSFYSLDAAGTDAVGAARSRPAAIRAAGAASAANAAPTLIVNPPHAAAGFDSRRIIYVRELHKLEYFAHSEWVDTPARMLAPLIVAALENGGAFRAVVLTPSAASGDLRLDTEIVRLQHEFGTAPSRVRFTLRAYLVEVKSRRVLASREFDASVPASSEDPYGGVLAANRAIQTVLGEMSAFCAEAARTPAIAAGG
jgi:cholesterol transport system auxiliary component